MTEAQSAAYNRLVALGELHFHGDVSGPASALSYRCQPLLVGPTGTGKTALARRVAEYFSAEFIRISPGEWMPRGSRDGVPTLRRILNACATADRVVVVADEVDKCSGETSSSWSRGVLGELYSLLDRELPVQEYLQAAENRSLSVEQLKERVAAIWIIGIGTWQTLWQHRKSMGFVAHRADVLPSIVEPIRKSGVIPDELLLRFAWPPVAVPYPTARETADLFERSGLNALAARAGVVLRPHEHDWHEGGMRSLETLVTELTLKIRAQLNAPES